MGRRQKRRMKGKGMNKLMWSGQMDNRQDKNRHLLFKSLISD